MNNLIAIESIRFEIASRVREVLTVNKWRFGGDLTNQQWNTIWSLSKGELTATELADKAGLQGPSVSRIIRDLEKAGIVDRVRRGKDLRRGRDLRTVYVSLTKKGKEIYKDRYRKVAAAMRLTEADKDSLRLLVGD